MFGGVFLNFSALSAQNGLHAEYYDGARFNKLMLFRTDAKIDFYWNQAPARGINPESFSVRWRGQIRPPRSGKYAFVAKVDDGIRVRIGGRPVIDSWQMNNHMHYDGSIDLEAGRLYSIEVEYFNGLLEGEARLMWRLPGDDLRNYQVIEPRYFYQPGATLDPPAPKPEAPKKVDKPAPPSPSLTAPEEKDTLGRYVPKNVLFVRGQSVILPESYPALDQFAAFLLRNPLVKVAIEGHTDTNGDAAKNQILSEDRARVVKEYLVQKGVAADRLSYKGYGETRPLSTEQTEEGFAQNRRVVFLVN